MLAKSMSTNPHPALIHSLLHARKEASRNVIPTIAQLTIGGIDFPLPKFQSARRATIEPPVSKTFHSFHSARRKKPKSRTNFRNLIIARSTKGTQEEARPTSCFHKARRRLTKLSRSLQVISKKRRRLCSKLIARTSRRTLTGSGANIGCRKRRWRDAPIRAAGFDIQRSTL